MSNRDRRHAHFIGICGKAMGGIAGALATEGWRVSGSDEQCYEPMRSYVCARSIAFSTRHDADNIPADVGVVIVGKRIAHETPELMEAKKRGLVLRSFPHFLREEFLHRSRNAVVTGGIGKTTTTAMLAWILEFNQRRPNYLIGGTARNFHDVARFGQSEFAVIEGDEYPSCFDDRRPKFLHYPAEVGIITNILEDHPDVYRSFDELCSAFAAFVDGLPANGCLVLPDDDEAALRLASRAKCKTIAVGATGRADHQILRVDFSPEASSFRHGGEDFTIPMCGWMNVRNAAMAATAAHQFGISLRDSAAALRCFRGVRKRQEEKSIGNCVMVLDKASHPRALTELGQALRQRFPARRIVSVIQPRATGGRDWIYQRDLPLALAHFDQVILTSAREHKPAPGRAWANAPFCLHSLAFTLRDRGTEVVIARASSEMRAAISANIQRDDVVLLTVLEQSEGLVRLVARGLRAKAQASLAEEAMLSAA